MNTDKNILPPSEENANSETPKTKKKSFVRISNTSRNRAAAKVTRPKSAPVVIEPEVLDEFDEEDDDRETDDDESSDVIDVGSFDGYEGNEEFDAEQPGRNLPARRAAIVPELVHEEEVFEEIPEERGLVAVSGLQRYLAELRKYPLLTAEEEKEVAFKAYEGDIQARNRLVTSNLRLVVKIAMEYRRAYSQILDLIQEGNAGLMQAVNRFNPYRGVKLSTYSAWWIRAYILKFLMDNKSLVRMGTTDAQRKLFFRLHSEAEKMYALTQRFDAHLLAENIGVKESDVVEMQQRLSKSDLSLDTPIGEDGEARQIDSLSADSEAPDQRMEREELLRLLRKEMHEVEQELNERDLFIFKNRIISDEPITLQDVGEKFGITRERARQLEARVLKKIKERLLARGLLD